MPYTESIHWFFTLFFFIFGSLLGSFSNVVVLRMAIKKSIVFPPSACPKCDHQLHAIDLVPIFSWLLLRGKCRYCQAPISIQYPLVESFMAIIVAFSFYRTGLSFSGLSFICLASGMAIWFVISTIFVRCEVLIHQPFIWAVIYSIVLKYLLLGKDIFGIVTFVFPVLIALLIGYIVKRLTKNSIEFTRWGCLTFLSFFYLNGSLWLLFPNLVALGLLEENTDKAKNSAKWIFFATQLIGIIVTISTIK